MHDKQGDAGYRQRHHQYPVNGRYACSCFILLKDMNRLRLSQEKGSNQRLSTSLCLIVGPLIPDPGGCIEYRLLGVPRSPEEREDILIRRLRRNGM